MSEGIESGPCQKVMFTDIINARVKSLDNQFLMIVNTFWTHDQIHVLYQAKEYSCQSVI